MPKIPLVVVKTRGENEPFSNSIEVGTAFSFDSRAEYIVEPVFDPGRNQNLD